MPEGNDLLLIDSVAEVVVTEASLTQHIIDHDFTDAFGDSTMLKYYDVGQSFRDWQMSRGRQAGETDFEVRDYGIHESYFKKEINLSQGDTFYIAAS